MNIILLTDISKLICEKYNDEEIKEFISNREAGTHTIYGEMKLSEFFYECMIRHHG